MRITEYTFGKGNHFYMLVGSVLRPLRENKMAVTFKFVSAFVVALRLLVLSQSFFLLTFVGFKFKF